MPYIDMREHKEAFALLQTVRKNFEGFTKRQIKQAKLARRAQAMVGHPTDEKFKQMVSSKSFANCRVKVKDVTNARAIFGPYLPGLGGKTTRQKPVTVNPEYENSNLPTYSVYIAFGIIMYTYSDEGLLSFHRRPR